jgi:type II secretory pathway pseudopilin PulG
MTTNHREGSADRSYRPRVRGSDQLRLRSGDAGYTLVALLALMTLLALFAVAAAPSVLQQTQREQEKEAIYRGEQVADAIRLYYLAHGSQPFASLPTSMDQLTEGVQLPGRVKKIQILRRSAARDPLSSTGEWHLVRPLTAELIDFQRSLISYGGGTMPQAQGPMAALQQNAVPQLTSVLNTGTQTNSSSSTTAGEDATGPFVGVASRSKRPSVIYYYGIGQHDLWIFTPLFR